MGRKKVLNLEERAKIEAYLSESFSNRKIARKIGRSEHVIRNFVKNRASYGKNYKGRIAKVVTPQDKRKIQRLASNSAQSTNKIREFAGVSCSKSTVRRVIVSAPHLKLTKLQKKTTA